MYNTSKNDTLTSSDFIFCQDPIKEYGYSLNNDLPYRNFVLVFVVINTLVAITASSSNIIVILTISRTPSLQKPSNVLILGLAITDLGIAVLSLPSFISYNIFNLHYNFQGYCRASFIFNFTSWIFTVSSLLTLSTITLDRFLVCHLHLRYSEIVTNKRYLFVLVVNFGLSALITVLRHLYTIRQIVMPTIILLLILVLFNVYLIYKISKVVHRHSTQIQAQQQSVQQSIDMPRYKKSVHTMYVMIGAFVLCYFPLVSAMVGHAVIRKWTLTLSGLFTVKQTIVMLNSLVNPVIYCWRIKEIRDAALHLFGCPKNVIGNVRVA